MYRPRHTRTYCRKLRKPTPFLDSAFGQLVLGAAFTFALALFAGLLFFSV